MPTERNDCRGAERLGSADILVVVSTCRPIVRTESGVIAVAAALVRLRR
eukprot:COSAG01_NODE_9863_length_2318_cov_4.913475_2_plen_49_part_00